MRVCVYSAPSVCALSCRLRTGRGAVCWPEAGCLARRRERRNRIKQLRWQQRSLPASISQNLSPGEREVRMHAELAAGTRMFTYCYYLTGACMLMM